MTEKSKGDSKGEAASSEDARRNDAPSPIGIWLPEIQDGEQVFVRPDPARLGDDWSPTKRLVPKTSSLPLRVCLIGESTAAGFFYAPHLTPAKVLEDQLRAIKGVGAYEVIDLTKVDMPADGSEHDLVRVTVSALQLKPDVLVIFAGNNWLIQMKPYARSGPDHLRRFAPAYREAGVRGVMEQCERDTRSHFQGVVQNLAYIAATAPIPMILVIPEVNQVDWVRDLPVAWLNGDRTYRWHKLYAKALAVKRTQDSQSVLVSSIAEQMIELDEGTCPVSYRLLAEARLDQGRTADAREMFSREVDSAAWNPGGLPGANSTVRDLLRSGAETAGLTCVDLPEIFFQHTAKGPDRDMFLDYCHLTKEGINVAMAAVASQVLRLTGAAGEQAYDWRSLLRLLPEPVIPRERDAVAKFLAALYSIHWERRLDRESSMPQYWCDAALRSWDGIQEMMFDYVATRIEPQAASGLSLAEQRLFGRSNSLGDGSHFLSGEGRRLQRFNLDPVAIELICIGLERLGRPVRKTINQLLVERHGVENRPIDLVDPFYHWSTRDQLTSFQGDSLTFSGYGLYQAFWHTSDFCFVSDGTREVQLDLTARQGAFMREGATTEVNVSVNAQSVGIARLGKSWGRTILKVGPEHLRAGTNRLTIQWPDLSDEGDAAMNRIGERLERAIPTNLEPVYGELQSLTARA